MSLHPVKPAHQKQLSAHPRYPIDRSSSSILMMKPIRATSKLDRTVNKIRSTQGEHTSLTTTAQVHEPEKMEQSSTETKAPEIIYLDSSNSSQEITRNTEDQRLPTQSEIYNSPHSSSVYKTPPSSPKCDSISDLNDDDIQ